LRGPGRRYRGPGQKCFCLTRPPGHHMHAQSRHGLLRVSTTPAIAPATHNTSTTGQGANSSTGTCNHGNGTQGHLLPKTARVLLQHAPVPLVSVDGRRGDGTGKGLGTNPQLSDGPRRRPKGIHVRLPDLLAPAVDHFKPELIISRPVRGHVDPLGQVKELTDEGLRRLDGLVLRWPQHCQPAVSRP